MTVKDGQDNPLFEGSEMEPLPGSGAFVAPRSPRHRARTTNDPFRLTNVDGRSAVARRFKDVVRQTIEALGVPAAELSPVTTEQVRAVGLLTIRLEALQERALTGEVSNEIELAIVRVTNSLARTRWQLGLGKRRRQDLGQTDLATYLAEKERRR
jgi:hypothetical protein